MTQEHLPGVLGSEGDEGRTDSGGSEGRWWCPHGWDADGHLCPEKRWLTKNEEAPK